MRLPVSLVLLGALLTTSAPAIAQAPAAPAPAEAAPPPAEAGSVSATAPEEPTLEEKRLVAYVATGVSLASLATGITFGILAQVEFDCAKDVVKCNGGLQNKIVGEELFDVRSEIEQKALAADMAFLFAAVSAVVATMGYLNGFVFTEEATMTSAVVPAPAPAPIVPAAPVSTTPPQLAGVTP
jgi:hypothetical protein